MYGVFMLFDEAGKPEKGERVYLGDAKGKNEGWLRDTLFENPEIIPVDDINSTFRACGFFQSLHSTIVNLPRAGRS